MAEYFVRHGQTDWNLEHRIQGTVDIELNDAGIRQAADMRDKERFYKTLKDELGTTSRFRDLAELYEGIAMTIYYYNHKRIHTALRMSPAAYAATLENAMA